MGTLSSRRLIKSTRKSCLQTMNMDKKMEECENSFELWIYLLKNIKDMDAIPTYLKDTIEEINYFESVMDEASLTDAERLRYEESLKTYWDEMDSRDFYINKGREEGREEGTLHVAKNMKGLGLSSELIVSATGLSYEEIERL